jgi:hypothetical protein
MFFGSAFSWLLGALNPSSQIGQSSKGVVVQCLSKTSTPNRSRSRLVSAPARVKQFLEMIQVR